jgi:hypothetical protein
MSGQTGEQTASAAQQVRGNMSDFNRDSEQQMGQARQATKERAYEMAESARKKFNKAYTRTSKGMNETPIGWRVWIVVAAAVCSRSDC